MKDIDDWDSKIENDKTRYYYYNKKDSQIIKTLESGVPNNLEIIYDAAPYVEIKNNVKDEEGAPSTEATPVAISLKNSSDEGITKNCNGEIIKKTGEKIPVVIKFENGTVKQVYNEKTNEVISDGSTIPLGDGDSIILSQIKKGEFISVEVKRQGWIEYESKYKFNDEVEVIEKVDNRKIEKDSVISIDSKQLPLVLTGILKDNPLAPLLMVTLLLLLYAGITMRKNRKEKETL